MIAGSLEIQLFANIARLQTDMNKANSVVSKAMGGVEKSVQLAKNALGGLGAGLLAREAILMTDAYTKMNAQLKNSTESLQEFNTAQEEVRRISSTAQADIGTITSLYQRLSLSLKETGASQRDIVDVAETVALSLKAMGASAQESSSTMLQLSQAFGSGRLAGEEFRALTEAAPNLMRSLAASMGVPFGALKKLASEGKITAGVLQKAFTDPALLASLRVQAGEMETISGAWQELKNEVMLFVGESATASGSVSVITGAISGLAKNIDTLAAGLEIAAAVMGARFVASMVEGAQASMAKVAASIALANAERLGAAAALEAAAAAEVLALAQVAQVRAAAAAVSGFYLNAAAVAALAEAEVAATVATNAHAAALLRMEAATAAGALGTRALNGALMLVGGPVGALVLIAGGLAIMAERMETAQESTARLRKEMDSLNREQLESGIQLQKQYIKELEREIQALSRSEAATGAVTKMAELLNRELEAEQKALQELERGMKGVEDREFEEMLLDMAGGAEYAHRWMDAATDSATGLGNAAGDSADKIAELISSMENEIKMLGMTDREQAIFEARLKAIAAGAEGETIPAIEALAAKQYDLAESLKPVNDAAQELIDKLAIEQAQISMSAREQAIFNAVLEAGTTAKAAQVEQIIAATNALFDEAAAQADLAEFTALANEAMDEYNATRADAKSSTAEIQKQIDLIGNESKAVEAAYDLKHGAHEKWTQDEKDEYLMLLARLEAEETAHDIYLEQERERAQVRKQLLKGLQNTLADALRAGTKEGAEDALDIFTDMLADMSTQWVAAQLMDFGAGFVNGGKQKSGGFDWGGAISTAMGIFGGGTAPAANEGLSAANYLAMMDGTFAGMKDNGGNVAAGNWAIAGEKGPEIVKGPATVVSRKDTAAMMGGNTTQNVSVNINVVNPRSEADGRKAGMSAAREFNAAVEAARRAS